MLYAETKWLKKDIELLPEVETYQRWAYLVIGRCKPRHEGEDSQLKAAMKHAAVAMRDRALKHIAKRADPEPGEERIRHNCSVTKVRAIHKVLIKKIDEAGRQWKRKRRIGWPV